MQTEHKKVSLKDQLLLNGQLFNRIRKNKTPEEKINKIQKYLDKGADINAQDANHKNNTPLHIAVLNNEKEIVEFLLKKGAVVNKKNVDDQTPLDIAKLLNTAIGNKIVTVLETHTKIFYPLLSSHQDIIKNSKKSDKVIEKQTSSDKRKHLNNEKCAKCNIKAPQFIFQKRSGTSGISGQLYETKLLSLILLRALNINVITNFWLGTNIEGTGAFDDIIFKYKLERQDKLKIIFIQAKHRDHPLKDKVTVEEVLKLNGDFSLHKYLDSYIRIKDKSVNSEDSILKGTFKDVDCEFIIYTPAVENFSKMKSVEQVNTIIEYLLSTGKTAKIFQFEYDGHDIDTLVNGLLISRTKSLAKSLTKLILKDNMMMDDLIKIYQVFLANNVIKVSYVASSSTYLEGMFRETFLDSADDLLIILKETIYNEITKTNDIHLRDEKKLLKSLSFKLPLDFGNLNFNIKGNEKKKKRRLDYLCLKLKQLLVNAYQQQPIDNDHEPTNLIVRLDDSLVGSSHVIKHKDIATYRIGGLVGNLLILDEKTQMLKFNMNLTSLPENIKLLFNQLQTDISIRNKLTRYRFDINIRDFPKITLFNKEHDKKLAKGFLDSLKFYTNQAKEDQVENIFKEEINKYYNVDKKQNETFFRIKGDAIFLKVHDEIQKWWKLPKEAPYLTETCTIFSQAKTDVIESPLLSILNFLYIKKIHNYTIKFNELAIKSLELDKFLKTVSGCLKIVTDEVTLTCIKLNQYFEVSKTDKTYMFVDLDLASGQNYSDAILNELNKSNINILVIINNKNIKVMDLKTIIKNFHKHVICVTNNFNSEELKHFIDGKCFQIFDRKNSLNDIDISSRKVLLEEKKISFQSREVPLSSLINDKLFYLIESEVLLRIINNDIIKIGLFTTSMYTELTEYYIKRNICCYVQLQYIKDNNDFMLIDKHNFGEVILREDKDLVLISHDGKEFDKLCKKYKEYNLHWFSQEGKEYIWKKSHGRLKKIYRYVVKRVRDSHSSQPKTLKDIKNKIVIIGAEPGMGKSSLLNIIALQTKELYPLMWVIKINLCNHRSEFRKWHENNFDIDLVEVMRFLYRVSNFQTCNENRLQQNDYKMKLCPDFSKLISIDVDKNVYLKKNDEDQINKLVLLEIQLFIHFYNAGQISLLFDGFDEISPDYTNVVIQLLKTLKTCKVEHIWISTRSYNILNKLEDELCTFSYILEPLSLTDQKLYLEKRWTNNVRFVMGNSHHLNSFISNFLKMITTQINDTENKFLSMPLHLYMIADIFQDYYESYGKQLTKHCKQDIIQTLNLNTLYERFIDEKFYKIRFGEKKSFVYDMEPDIKKMIDKEHKDFRAIHKKIAAYTILDKHYIEGTLSEQERNDIHNFMEIVKLGEEKTGIIEQIIENEPKFVHYTYAEYFAAEYLCDKLKSTSCTSSTWFYLINSIFTTDKGNVRKFIDYKLAKDQELFNLSTKKKYKEEILQALLSQLHTTPTALYVAVDEYCENNAMFLLQSINTILNKDNLNDFINIIIKRYGTSCLFCCAVERRSQKVITHIIQYINNIDKEKFLDLFYCHDIPNFNALLLAINYCKFEADRKTLDILLQDVDASIIVKLFTEALVSDYRQTVLHVLAINNDDLTVVAKYMQKLSIDQRIIVFNANDNIGRLPAHYAALVNNFDFFYVLEETLGKSQFAIICTSRDTLGLAPIQLFKYILGNCDKINALKEKVNQYCINDSLRRLF